MDEQDREFYIEHERKHFEESYPERFPKKEIGEGAGKVSALLDDMWEYRVKEIRRTEGRKANKKDLKEFCAKSFLK